MTWEIWPCDTCREAGHETLGVRNVGKRGYCTTHLQALYASFGIEAWVDGGVGIQTGPQRPEYGPLEADLTCCCCLASWTGIPGDPCWWCQRAREIQTEHQTDLLLTPPDLDPADVTFEARMGAWADRLIIGVNAGLITQAQADTVWKRAVRKAVA